MAIALDPSIVTQQSENYVDVETSSELTWHTWWIAST